MSPNSRMEHAKLAVDKAKKTQVYVQDQAPRFNYNEYMSKLKERLNLNGTSAAQKIGSTDF